MVDLDNSLHIHWMVVNVPGADVDKGDTIAEYNSPTPAKGTGAHRWETTAVLLFIALISLIHEPGI